MRHSSIYSNYHYLLARLTTDLQLCGAKPDDFKLQQPFKDKYITVYDDGVFCYRDCVGCGNPDIHKLTEKNYNEVLTQILKNP